MEQMTETEVEVSPEQNCSHCQCNIELELKNRNTTQLWDGHLAKHTNKEERVTCFSCQAESISRYLNSSPTLVKTEDGLTMPLREALGVPAGVKIKCSLGPIVDGVPQYISIGPASS